MSKEKGVEPKGPAYRTRRVDAWDIIYQKLGMSSAAAFQYFVDHAYTEDGTHYRGPKRSKVILKKGQFYSYRTKLAGLWGVDRKTVGTWLEEMAEGGLIELKREIDIEGGKEHERGFTITVVDYDKYFMRSPMDAIIEENCSRCAFRKAADRKVESKSSSSPDKAKQGIWGGKASSSTNEAKHGSCGGELSSSSPDRAEQGIWGGKTPSSPACQISSPTDEISSPAQEFSSPDEKISSLSGTFLDTNDVNDVNEDNYVKEREEKEGKDLSLSPFKIQNDKDKEPNRESARTEKKEPEADENLIGNWLLEVAADLWTKGHEAAHADGKTPFNGSAENYQMTAAHLRVCPLPPSDILSRMHHYVKHTVLQSVAFGTYARNWVEKRLPDTTVDFDDSCYVEEVEATYPKEREIRGMLADPDWLENHPTATLDDLYGQIGLNPDTAYDYEKGVLWPQHRLLQLVRRLREWWWEEKGRIERKVKSLVKKRIDKMNSMFADERLFEVLDEQQGERLSEIWKIRENIDADGRFGVGLSLSELLDESNRICRFCEELPDSLEEKRRSLEEDGDSLCEDDEKVVEELEEVLKGFHPRAVSHYVYDLLKRCKSDVVAKDMPPDYDDRKNAVRAILDQEEQRRQYDTWEKELLDLTLALVRIVLVESPKSPVAEFIRTMPEPFYWERVIDDGEDEDDEEQQQMQDGGEAELRSACGADPERDSVW